jgi:hypothetical protein
MGEAITFLQRLRPGGPWHLIAIAAERNRPMRGCRATSAETARQFIANYGHRNIFYSVNRCGEMAGVKAKKADITHIEYVHADLDPAPGEVPKAAKERYRAALKASGLPAPSFVIDSGNGLQMLWRISPVRVEDQPPSVVGRVEGINRAVMAMLGCHDTSTHNIDRVLRLPATTNHPDSKKRAAGRVRCTARLISAADGVYALHVFPQPTSVQPATTGDRDGGAGGWDDLDPMACDPRAVVTKYKRRLKPQHVSLMTEKIMMSEVNSRYRMVFIIVAELYDAGASWNEIASVVWASPYFVSKRGKRIDRLVSELSRIADYIETSGIVK